MTGLRLGPRFTVPINVVTETLAILAVKRAGKSNTAVVMAEEMYAAGLPWVAIDPKGDWWGMRAAGDGARAGLEVVVFGGEHGDLPLEPTAGRLIADLIVDKRITCVLDVSEMYKAEQRQFLHDFAERLYRRNREPLHVFCEEADEYIPQHIPSSRGEKGLTPAKLVGVFETLVKRGGFRGIGVTLITQRSASLNKDVLTQVGTLIAMRTPSPQDRKAIYAWIDYHDAGRDIIDELPTLENGSAWVISPEFLGDIKKVAFRRRKTFDSGATPEVGKKVRPPTRLADVDLAAIKEEMAETVKKAEASDPKLLAKRVAELERDKKMLQTKLTQWEEHQCAVIEKVEPVEVSVLTDGDREHLQNVQTILTDVLTKMRAAPVVKPSSRVITPASRERINKTLHRVNETKPVPRPREAVAGSGEPPSGDISDPDQRILDAIAWWNAVGFDTPTKQQIGFIAGYKAGKRIVGAYANYLGRLRSAGYIDYPVAGAAALTDAGRELARIADFEPTTEALQDAIMSKLGDPEQRILRVLVKHYPNALTKQDLGEAAGYTVGARVVGAYANYLGRLRSLGLIDYPAAGQAVACDVLFLKEDRA